MFRRILVPVDIADPVPAKPAIATAAHLAEGAPESEVRLIYVIPFLIDAALEYLPKDFFAREGEEAKERLRGMALDGGLEEDRTTYAAPCGAIHHLVLEEAQSFGTDLIIIGSHAPSISNYWLGSSASAIVRQASCSVLVRRS